MHDSSALLVTTFSSHQHLNLECTIHLLYLVTPYDAVADVKPQWMTYFDTLSALDPVEIKAAELIGKQAKAPFREQHLANGSIRDRHLTNGSIRTYL